MLTRRNLLSNKLFTIVYFFVMSSVAVSFKTSGVIKDKKIGLTLLWGEAQLYLPYVRLKKDK